MIVDAHAHVYPVIAGVGRDDAFRHRLPPTYAAADLLAALDTAGVRRAVLLQGPYYGACDDAVAAAVGGHPQRLRGAIYLDPWAVRSPFGVPAGFVAAKLEFSAATGLHRLRPGARLDDPSVTWVWESLARQGVVLVLDLGAVGAASYQTEAARRIAETQPALRIVIAHLAQPPREASRRHAWREQLDLGLLPNVCFDLAALPAYVAHEGFPWPTVGGWIREACERVGARKLLWGSDAPGLLAVATYAQLLEAAHLHLAFLSPAEQAWVLGENAEAVYEPHALGRGTEQPLRA